MKTRRDFMRQAAAAAALLPAAARGAQGSGAAIPLDGPWQFRIDPQERGELEGWHHAGTFTGGWREVSVPHTWQVQPETAGHFGAAWYRRSFDAPAWWSSQTVRVEFEAVYHTAAVWVNGKPVGRHAGKGYTAFAFDITDALRQGANLIAVRADNSFNDRMLPRGKSYDWAGDGGIIRPVTLLVTPTVYIERVDVDALPDLEMGNAQLQVRVAIRNASRNTAAVPLAWVVEEEDAGRAVLRREYARPVDVPPGTVREVSVPGTLTGARLWHFDHPYLYRLTADIGGHQYATNFGVRRFEARPEGFLLNGEPVRLMGVERMAGSRPEYGMAEPASWIEHNHRDMKELNCVFTRVHWPQDRRVLDYCDRHGILIQVEVPGWGPRTFQGMGSRPDYELLENGLEQLREMIGRDRNHPSVFAWGLSNEVNGQNPAAQEFVRRMFEEARRLDPHRLLTYASNSLQNATLAEDIAGTMDYIAWNEYYESWMRGTQEDLIANLDRIRKAFPGKPLVVSEYGWCECSPKHIGGDRRRADVLSQHTRIFRGRPWVAGAIFFSYNDYRTHMGDKGIGPLRQRVHGVVDLYGERKPSFDALRQESSPVAVLSAVREAAAVAVRVRARRDLPAYTLRGYTVRCVTYTANVPMEAREAALPRLLPGAEVTVRLPFKQPKTERMRVEVVRPTGFTAAAIVR